MLSRQAKNLAMIGIHAAILQKVNNFICEIDFVDVYISVQAKDPTMDRMHAAI